MATVVYGDHPPFEIDDNRADLVAYYRGEGATVTLGGEDVVGEVVEIEHPGTGEEMHGVEHPADGTMSPEISNDPLDLH